MSADLPEWVVERCIVAASVRQYGATSTEAALAGFLALLEERGLRIVPVEATDTMIAQGQACLDVADEDPIAIYENMIEAAPRLAELLEDAPAAEPV